MKSNYADKLVPSVRSVKKALQSLSAVLNEKHENFKMTSHQASKIESLLNQLVKDGILYKGKCRKYNRVGFNTVLAMADAWLLAGLTDGVLSWDTHLSKLLSIVLISAFASRCGDVVRTTLYKGMEAVMFSDLSVQYEGGDQDENLVMNVTLRFVKGYK
jgi:hypothetical protein